MKIQDKLFTLLALLLLGVGQAWGQDPVEVTREIGYEEFSNFEVRIDRAHQITKDQKLIDPTKWYLVLYTGNTYYLDGGKQRLVDDLVNSIEPIPATEIASKLFKVSGAKNSDSYSSNILCGNGKWLGLSGEYGNLNLAMYPENNTSGIEYDWLFSYGVSIQNQSLARGDVLMTDGTSLSFKGYNNNSRWWAFIPVKFYQVAQPTRLDFQEHTVQAMAGTSVTNTATLYNDNGLHTPIEGKIITYSVREQDKDKVTIDENTGEVSINADASGEVRVTATFAGGEGYAASSDSYSLIITENDPTRPTVHYTILVSGGSGSEFAAIINGINYENGREVDMPMLTRDEVTCTTPVGFIYFITISDVVGGKATIKVSYTQNFAWSIRLSGYESFPPGTQVNVSVSGKVYPVNMSTGILAFSSTLEFMATSFINSTYVEGYTYTVSVDNVNRIIDVAYQVRRFAPPSPGSFIRIMNITTANVITSKPSSSYLATGEDVEQSIIYYTSEGKFLFYKDGRYMNANVSLAPIPSTGNSFTFENNDGVNRYFWIKNDASQYVKEIQSFGVSYAYPDANNAGNSQWLISILPTIPVTVTQAGHGYATLFCPENLKIPSGVQAYVPIERTSKGEAGEYTLTLKRISTGYIPKETPVILYSAQAANGNITFNFPIVKEDIAPIDGRWEGLTGTCPAINTTTGDYTLQPVSGSNKVGFYKWKQATILPFKAYISAGYTGAVNGFRFEFEEDDEVTGLDEVMYGDTQGEILATRYYTADGRQVAAPVKGVTIAVDIYSDGTQKTRKYMKTK